MSARMKAPVLLCSLLLFSLVALLLAQEKVDGGWTEWSYLSESDCSEPCGGGEQTKVRTCTNPKPQNGGEECEGPDSKTVKCNEESCDDRKEQSEWGDWSECSTTCGQGRRERQKSCVEGEEDGYKCDKVRDDTWEVEKCRTWPKFYTDKCPSPCNKKSDEYRNMPSLKKCPDRAKCTDLSDEMGPARECKCVMGYELDEANWICRERPPKKPTPRPIPTLSPVEKVVAVVVTKTASTVLLIMVGLTLTLFILMRVFTVDRVIQMNMEASLLIAHLFLLFPNEMAEENPEMCRVISVSLHFFFTGCFVFLFLESLHVYAMVAFVVPRNGLLGRFQNMLVGWSISALIILVTVCFFLDDYGAEYHCWTQMDKPLVYLVIGPVICLCILDFVMLEAAGNADYKPLKLLDHRQLLSSKIHQRSNLILMPLVLASFIVGMLSDYEQNLFLYSIFSVLNTVLGVLVFFFHTFGNDLVRQKVKEMCRCCFKAEEGQ